MKESIVVAGLNVEVHSARDLRVSSSELPISVLFFLHGRGGSTASLGKKTEAIIKMVDEKQTASSKPDRTNELVVVTFDHRNHGHRLVSPLANNDWHDEDPNPNHAIDMYSIQTGTARDVSFLIDFLPAFLFPSGERTISRWLVTGISLGGHSAWITLRKEPRVRVGIPIIACPDYLSMISERARHSGVNPSAPCIPDHLRTLIKQNDPIHADYESSDAHSNPFFGKKILLLSGGNDEMVPWAHSAEFFDKLNVGEGVKKSIVAAGVGHACTMDMIKELVEFIWENGVLS